ncbi:hypothetical protein D8674_003201 [Pyrus ussuriensis x Pyrus communis]|uniref:Uncharacterized protein n=1 Tax=Pyrus ussuriensis x Pyrus communis TaxID=2448454 RepID=A0A5N5FGE9_9ROSA|nr:hypothetical protein D8674_003201 [Pyrus ussuriensis x Pyrus communis]
MVAYPIFLKMVASPISPQMVVRELDFPLLVILQFLRLAIVYQISVASNKPQCPNPFYRSRPQDYPLWSICPLSIEKSDRASMSTAHHESKSPLIQLKVCETRHLGFACGALPCLILWF